MVLRYQILFLFEFVQTGVCSNSGVHKKYTVYYIILDYLDLHTGKVANQIVIYII